QGIQGVNGAIGPTGPLGIQGVNGIIGPTGPQGVPGVGLIGPTGQVGPTGPQGLSGLEIVVASTLYPAIGAFVTSVPATAQCPFNKVIVGGGFELANGTNLVLTASEPLGNTSWKVNFLNPGTALGQTTIKVSAICVFGP